MQRMGILQVVPQVYEFPGRLWCGASAFKGHWWNWIGQEVSRLWRWKQEVLNKWLQLTMHCVQRDSPELLERACFPSQKANTSVICKISKQGVGEEAAAEAGRNTTVCQKLSERLAPIFSLTIVSTSNPIFGLL